MDILFSPAGKLVPTVNSPEILKLESGSAEGTVSCPPELSVVALGRSRRLPNVPVAIASTKTVYSKLFIEVPFQCVGCSKYFRYTYNPAKQKSQAFISLFFKKKNRNIEIFRIPGPARAFSRGGRKKRPVPGNLDADLNTHPPPVGYRTVRIRPQTIRPTPVSFAAEHFSRRKNIPSSTPTGRLICRNAWTKHTFVTKPIAIRISR